MKISSEYKVLLHFFLDPYFTSDIDIQTQKFYKNSHEKIRTAQSLDVFTFGFNCIKMLLNL